MKKRIERGIRWEHTHNLRSSRPLTRVTTSPRDYSSESTRRYNIVTKIQVIHSSYHS
ncbi:unnamed protein product [Brassica oleracea]